MKIRRSQYVSTIWNQATNASPGIGLEPSEYGWNITDNILQPTWFEGPALPSTLFKTNYVTDVHSMEEESNHEEAIILTRTDMDQDSEYPDELDELIPTDDEPWSEVSDSEQEDTTEY